MAHRRRQQQQLPPRRQFSSVPGQYDYEASTPAAATASSLAAKAIRASSAHMDSSLSSAYATTPLSSSPVEDFRSTDHVSVESLTELKHGFWGALVRRAKSIIEDTNVTHLLESPSRVNAKMVEKNVAVKHHAHQSYQNEQRLEPQTLRKGLDAITSSINYIGGNIGVVVEEGLTVVENRAAEIIRETRNNMKKKPGRYQKQDPSCQQQPPVEQFRAEAEMQTNKEIQLKASRDVAMAMAAKAKLLLRELKTAKADLAFAKELCAQLEEENKNLRETFEPAESPEDDDLIRLQLETLLAEKARLARENSVFARENRFLREVVEYHQLTMQDVIYLDEASEEVSEVYPSNKAPSLLNRPASAALTAASLPNFSICCVPPPGMR